jgi:hypothetical protein
MTGVIFLLLIASVVYLMMKRRGRVFLESEEGIVLGLTLLLCLAQKIFRDSISLSDIWVTPFYIAIVICPGHARGSSRGAICGFFASVVVSFCALAFAESVAAPSAGHRLPMQYMVFMVLWMLMGGLAGLREIPKVFKPLLSALWLLFVAAYHPQFLRNLDAYIILFGAVALASLGLYYNLFKSGVVSTIFYPTSPSRRAAE